MEKPNRAERRKRAKADKNLHPVFKALRDGDIEEIERWLIPEEHVWIERAKIALAENNPKEAKKWVDLIQRSVRQREHTLPNRRERRILDAQGKPMIERLEEGARILKAPTDAEA